MHMTRWGVDMPFDLMIVWQMIDKEIRKMKDRIIF